jgi:hypothetical protein
MFKPLAASATALGAFACIVWSGGPSLAKGSDTGPPPGSVPTTATLAQVLAAHQQAEGKILDPDATLVEDGRIAAGGLTGTYHEVVAGGDFVETRTLGPFSTAFGSVGGQRWNSDENGQVVRQAASQQRGSAGVRAVDAAVASPQDDAKLLGEVAGSPTAYIVEVDPPDGQREWIFYDKTTYLVDRTETIEPSARVVETFADYRQSDGTWESWSGTWADGDPQHAEDWSVTTQHAGVTVDRSAFAIPASRALVEFPAGISVAALPVRFEHGAVIIRLNIGGRGYDFQLDSGASDILVDPGAAYAMGLTNYGGPPKVIDGRMEAGHSVIPEIDVATLKMHNVAVTIIPFRVQKDSQTAVVGLVGYDFIAGITLWIDYADGAAMAFAPGQYAPPSSAYAVDMSLKHLIPVVAAKIGSSTGDRFIVDTGADYGYIFPAFVASHPRDLADLGGGRMMAADYPIMIAHRLGASYKVKPIEVKNFDVGRVSFTQWMVYTMPDDVSPTDEEYDGLIGYDFLKYFTLVLDYADSMIYLEPNALFEKSKS